MRSKSERLKKLSDILKHLALNIRTRIFFLMSAIQVSINFLIAFSSSILSSIRIFLAFSRLGEKKKCRGKIVTIPNAMDIPKGIKTYTGRVSTMAIKRLENPTIKLAFVSRIFHAASCFLAFSLPKSKTALTEVLNVSFLFSRFIS